MRKNYSLRGTCTLSNGYTITIPKLIRESLNLTSGDEVTISLKSKDLIIQKLYKDTLENNMILNDRGSVKIPQEFIKLLSLESGDVFNLYLTNSNIIILRINAKF
ncbi:AbrB/MazE/SpoVT family DNA-binding domain-containing protein [Oceanobacillus alkalisoli]|uniref:AbrB/MazE/SpoVT family DNA-binding domain-containing protein n=1 Tax=Oceanobacillus alkalisoli TaxID=2925113 RepID=UPI001EF0FCDD|nr:AbrB/MazE/SpoVT family DNA-binding domain-containing protein [Oceanobacillus alkalisoli]MCF3942257.1 AbrB/MazE/SpoVT family DNA-binding domain-containing protein [Oceanobacillus alkalisoli]MCG5104493.1 AbrB/MazE/SpoVT family DNA-binding domain-containing protein [Oceanobacillus alkalisoli]